MLRDVDICLVSPAGYPHAAAFAELADGLSRSFALLGAEAPVVNQIRPGRTPVLLGAHLIPPRLHPRLPADAVIVNLEPLQTAVFATPDYLALLRSRRVIDYSEANVAILRREPGGRVVHMPIGWSDVLERITPAPAPDIDVLFYGSTDARRDAVLDGVRRAGLKLEVLFGVYGAERDARIARSKLVLNLRHADGNPFEIVRVAYLLNNRVCVVSEDTPGDPALAPLRAGLRLAPYDALADACRALAPDPDARRRIADAGYQALRARPQHELLAHALAELAAL